MSRQVSCGSAGEYQEDEQAGVAYGLNATIKILQVGVATITVETIDGSYLTATCEIDAVSAINQTMSDTANAEYYTIDGLKLAKKPSRGIYIMKQGNTVRKVVL